MSADFKKWRSIGRIQDYLEEIDRKYQYTETRMNAKVNCMEQMQELFFIMEKSKRKNEHRFVQSLPIMQDSLHGFMVM